MEIVNYISIKKIVINYLAFQFFVFELPDKSYYKNASCAPNLYIYVLMIKKNPISIF
jgi:hypothetical protein